MLEQFPDTLGPSIARQGCEGHDPDQKQRAAPLDNLNGRSNAKPRGGRIAPNKRFDTYNCLLDKVWIIEKAWRYDGLNDCAKHFSGVGTHGE